MLPRPYVYLRDTTAGFRSGRFNLHAGQRLTAPAGLANPAVAGRLQPRVDHALTAAPRRLT
jgi:hypothetical protein